MNSPQRQPPTNDAPAAGPTPDRPTNTVTCPLGPKKKKVIFADADTDALLDLGTDAAEQIKQVGKRKRAADGAGAGAPPPLKRTHSIHVIPEGDDAKTEPETETDTDTKPAAWTFRTPMNTFEEYVRTQKAGEFNPLELGSRKPDIFTENIMIEIMGNYRAMVAALAAAPASAPAPAPQFRGFLFFVAPAPAPAPAPASASASAPAPAPAPDSSSMSVHGRGLARLHAQNKRRLKRLLDQSWVDLSQNDKETAMKHSEIMMNDLMDAGIDHLPQNDWAKTTACLKESLRIIKTDYNKDDCD